MFVFYYAQYIGPNAHVKIFDLNTVKFLLDNQNKTRNDMSSCLYSIITVYKKNKNDRYTIHKYILKGNIHFSIKGKASFCLTLDY